MKKILLLFLTLSITILSSSCQLVINNGSDDSTIDNNNQVVEEPSNDNSTIEDFISNEPNEDDTELDNPTEEKENMIKSVKFIRWLTGVNSTTNTYTNWKVGGTDLGIPYYDSYREKMYFLFGDTFSSINSTSSDWRSQTVGVTTDLDASDGILFDYFLHDVDGFAKPIIDARHMGDYDKGEVTCIPTGAIAINGVHYVFYMSVESWADQSTGWRINFCNVAKSTDGENFHKLDSIIWCNDTEIARNNAVISLDVSNIVLEAHPAPDFLQVFPYYNKEDGYIYLFGLSSGRTSGVKLARVKPESIENRSDYEYLQADGTWINGNAGLDKLYKNPDSYIINSKVGELSVIYNPYLNKYMMGYYTDAKIVVRFSDNLINWSEEYTLATSERYPLLYGCFMNEIYMEDNGKSVYFFMSQYFQEALGDNGYNVRVMKVTFE